MIVHRSYREKVNEMTFGRGSREKFSNFNPANSSFTAGIDEYDRVVVKLKRARGRSYTLFNSDDEVNGKLPKTITVNLGQPASKIEAGEEEIARRIKKIAELQDQLETASENQRENLNQTIAGEQDAVAQLESVSEEVEERITLRDRVKAIFKKYGLTVFAVVSAVRVVIGVIAANLKNVLTSLGRGVGGLKTTGKKLGEILPGLVGAIGSFVFRTAGEVVGAPAKNAWC